MVSSQKSILIGDDDHKFRTLIANAFQKRGWIVHTVKDGREVTNRVRNFSPDIILLNIAMPIRDGIATCRILRTDISITQLFPIILIGDSPDRKQIVKAIEAGCDEFILKPVNFEVLLAKIEKLVELYRRKVKKDEQKSVSYQKEEHEAEVIVYSRKAIKRIFSNAMRGESIDYPVVQEVVNTMIEIVHKESNIPMAFKMKSYNEYTYIHSINVASLCMSFAFHLNWHDDDLRIVGEGGFLHDIGKTRIDLKILLKPEKLNEAEFSEIKKHPLFGKEIIPKQNILEEIIKVVMEHHECIDGSGYPHKLHNGQISKYGKLCAIVDMYDALTTDRCYRRAIESEEAAQLMSKLRGKFDPEMFDKFIILINSNTIGK